MIRNIFVLLLSLVLAFPLEAAELRKYAKASKVYFTLVNQDGVDFNTSATCAAGDVQISKNGGAFANIADSPCFDAVGNGVYVFDLSATELTAADVTITIKDQTNPKVWLDDAVVIETYGDVSAHHKFDLDSRANLETQRTIFFGTVDTGSFTATTTDFEADVLDGAGTAISQSTNDFFNKRIIIFTSGALYGQATTITDYTFDHSNGKFTVTGLTGAPANGATFVII